MTKGNFEFQSKLSVGDTMAENLKKNTHNLRKESLREKFSDFENVEHRLEFVANVHGIEYINDSKATNINSTWYALERMQRETVWIVGGVKTPGRGQLFSRCHRCFQRPQLGKDIFSISGLIR